MYIMLPPSEISEAAALARQILIEELLAEVGHNLAATQLPQQRRPVLAVDAAGSHFGGGVRLGKRAGDVGGQPDERGGVADVVDLPADQRLYDRPPLDRLHAAGKHHHGEETGKQHVGADEALALCLGADHSHERGEHNQQANEDENLVDPPRGDHHGRRFRSRVPRHIEDDQPVNDKEGPRLHRSQAHQAEDYTDDESQRGEDDAKLASFSFAFA
eukprot:CAMPEP_0171264130 /NCGR_PEP_ID=MMETSP0790-20130122/57456_1 /TAXON_ID=2925 /ORGANISM="Alexandrium catenella, Strain OF101" /LENGTH=215 /DNA_ID=CAMNT_0011732769 /DNA_START=186 /DNA_END=830 /DNA_ORIENTATION=+